MIDSERRGWLFDVDGVLVDSRHLQEANWSQWHRERRLPADQLRVLLQLDGMSAWDRIRRVRPGISNDRLRREVERIEEIELANAAATTALPGATEAFVAARSGQPLALVTSGCEALIEARLTGAGLPHWPTAVYANPNSAGKPRPTPYLRGALLLSRHPSECVGVEDTPAGLTALREAEVGIRVALTTTTDVALLHQAGATAIFANLLEAMPYIQAVS